MMHISFDEVNEFGPRIPYPRLSDEDGSIPRICMAPTILQALRAIPGGGDAVRNMQSVGMPVVVHAYYLHGCEIVDNSVVKKMVSDAIFTGETWAVTKPAKVVRVDWELSNMLYSDTLTEDGRSSWRVESADLKRVPHQDNWMNLAKTVMPGREEEFLSKIPKHLSFRTLMQNLPADVTKAWM